MNAGSSHAVVFQTFVCCSTAMEKLRSLIASHGVKFTFAAACLAHAPHDGGTDQAAAVKLQMPR